MTSPLNRFLVDSKNTRKHWLACNFPSSLDFSKDINEDRGIGGAVHNLPSFDHEFWDAVNTEVVEGLQCHLNLLPPLISLKKGENFPFRHRGWHVVICNIVPVQSHKLCNFFSSDLGQLWLVIQGVPIDKIISVQPIIKPLADAQTICLANMLDESVRCHGIAGQPIQVEMGNTSCQASSLEVVSSLLLLPTSLTAPLFYQTFTIRLDEGLVFVVVWLQKEGHT